MLFVYINFLVYTCIGKCSSTFLPLTAFPKDATWWLYLYYYTPLPYMENGVVFDIPYINVADVESPSKCKCLTF